MNKLDTIMENEIKRRMESSSWDYHIASTVLGNRARKRKNLFLKSSFSIMGAAAIIAVVFMFSLKEIPAPGGYNKFISEQIEGTYKEAFEIKDVKSVKDSESSRFIASQIRGTYDEVFRNEPGYTAVPGNGDVIIATDTDSIIDETLSMR